MGDAADIDPRMQAALARLTDNEKECLRRRLRQQTAKEMALELGVSPHAVEKRLKMARAKLGLSSSLEAARLLAATEGYQQAGPQAADLVNGTPKSHHRLPQNRITGAVSMIVIAAAALAVAMQMTPAENSTNQPRILSAREYEWVEAPPEEVRAWLEMNFLVQDHDNSGFIESAEVPDGFGIFRTPAMRDGRPVIRTAAENEEGRRRWLAETDRDGDGRIGREEYVTWRLPLHARLGVPKDWRGLARRGGD